MGDSRERIKRFSDTARSRAGYELRRVQSGLEPSDWKGVREIRVRDGPGAYRVIYTATVGLTIYVLHAFQKKSQRTERKHLELAHARLRQIGGR